MCVWAAFTQKPLKRTTCRTFEWIHSKTQTGCGFSKQHSELISEMLCIPAATATFTRIDEVESLFISVKHLAAAACVCQVVLCNGALVWLRTQMCFAQWTRVSFAWTGKICTHWNGNKLVLWLQAFVLPAEMPRTLDFVFSCFALEAAECWTVIHSLLYLTQALIQSFSLCFSLVCKHFNKQRRRPVNSVVDSVSDTHQQILCTLPVSSTFLFLFKEMLQRPIRDSRLGHNDSENPPTLSNKVSDGSVLSVFCLCLLFLQTLKLQPEIL